jgi:hypothetical protein
VPQYRELRSSRTRRRDLSLTTIAIWNAPITRLGIPLNWRTTMR